MTVRENTEAMAKNEYCVEEECRFYSYWDECATDCCMFGASEEDKESEKPCASAQKERYLYEGKFDRRNRDCD